MCKKIKKKQNQKAQKFGRLFFRRVRMIYSVIFPHRQAPLQYIGLIQIKDHKVMNAWKLPLCPSC